MTYNYNPEKRVEVYFKNGATQALQDALGYEAPREKLEALIKEYESMRNTMAIEAYGATVRTIIDVDGYQEHDVDTSTPVAVQDSIALDMDPSEVYPPDFEPISIHASQIVWGDVSDYEAAFEVVKLPVNVKVEFEGDDVYMVTTHKDGSIEKKKLGLSTALPSTKAGYWSAKPFAEPGSFTDSVAVDTDESLSPVVMQRLKDYWGF